MNLERPKTPPTQNSGGPSSILSKSPSGAGPLSALTPSKRGGTEGGGSIKQTPTFCIHVDLKKAVNTNDTAVLDFMKEVEDQYGFETVHPDIKTAMDIANMDDDMDDDDNDNDDDVDLTESNNNNNNNNTSANTNINANSNPNTSNNAPTTQTTTQEPKPKNRGRVEGKYDLNDPFIDDAETQWEEQAASTKDGFFVYSGPLVQAGEQPKIERADGTLKKGKDNANTGGSGNNSAGGGGGGNKGKGGAAKGKKKEPGGSGAGNGGGSNSGNTKAAKSKSESSKPKDGNTGANSNGGAKRKVIDEKTGEVKERKKPGPKPSKDKGEKKESTPPKKQPKTETTEKSQLSTATTASSNDKTATESPKTSTTNTENASKPTPPPPNDNTAPNKAEASPIIDKTAHPSGGGETPMDVDKPESEAAKPASENPETVTIDMD